MEIVPKMILAGGLIGASVFIALLTTAVLAHAAGRLRWREPSEPAILPPFGSWSAVLALSGRAALGITASYFLTLASVLFAGLLVLGPSSQPVGLMAAAYGGCACLALGGILALSPFGGVWLRGRAFEIACLSLAMGAAVVLLAVIGIDAPKAILASGLVVLWSTLWFIARRRARRSGGQRDAAAGV